MKSRVKQFVVCMLTAFMAIFLLPWNNLQVNAECSPSDKCDLEVELSDDGTKVVGIKGHVAYWDTAYNTSSGNEGKTEATRVYNFVFTSKASMVSASTEWRGGVQAWDYLDSGNMIFTNPTAYTTTTCTESNSQYGLIEGDIEYTDDSAFSQFNANTTYYGLLIAKIPNSGIYYTNTYVTIKISDSENFRYSVNFNYKGHGGTDFTLPVNKNATVTETAVTTNPDYGKWSATQQDLVANWSSKVIEPTCEGYSFRGWYTDEDCTQAYSFDSAVTSNVNLYAKWKKIPVASDFTFTAPSSLTYDGEEKSATVEKNAEDGMGDVTVYYSTDGETWTTSVPTDAGTYKVAIDVTEGDKYTAAKKLTSPDWEFTIEKADSSITTPTAAKITDSKIIVDSLPEGPGDTEYAISESPTAPTDDSEWQSGTTFTGLDPKTTYYIFARYTGDHNYNPVVSDGLVVTTEKHADKKATHNGNNNNHKDSASGKSVKTGDSADIGLYTILMIAGISGFTFLYRKKRHSVRR